MKLKDLSPKVKKGIAIAAAATIAASGAIVAGVAINNKNKNNGPVVPPAKGLGVFYFDAGIEEYQLSLEDGNKVTFIIDGVSKSGTYTNQGDNITLKFDGEEVAATLDGNVLMMNYNDSQMRFFKKIYYTVSYEELGGNTIADTTVVNGKTFAKPADPTREGYEFLGWYTDSEYTTPYSFGTQVVTSDITLYAQWALVDPSVSTFVVDFDLGYDGAPAIAETTTIGGKLYNAPVPERKDYKFCGWWISDDEDGARLTYKYTEDTVFTANTTLFAVWEAKDMGSKLSAPEVEVFDNVIKWNGISGVSIYHLKVRGPEGFLAIDDDISATSYPLDFSKEPAGDYTIEVTAVASNTDNSSDTVVRGYKNKAVGRVSQFSVLDGKVLLFNRVPNAETYYITVDCGNDAHTHTMYNNGDSTYFNFSNCEMQEGGIRFTVTAVADGYASVTSETFVYNRTLDKVEGVSVDEDTQVLSWYPVKDATNYIVSVLCGDESHEHTLINVGSKTSFSLKECPGAENGIITVSVYAQTKGYNSAAATEITYNKTKLASPSNVVMNNVDKRYVLTWNEVEGATGYEIKIGTSIFETADTQYDLTEDFTWVTEADYQIEVKAKSDSNESVWSDPINIRYYAMVNKLSYKGGIVSWTPVIGATGYEVKVNNGGIITVDNGDTFAEIELTQEGANTIYVRFIDTSNNYYSPNWATLEITNAQEIIFDSRGGSEVASQYKVIGDKITLPTPTREGYDFVGWYNTPKGPESNGAKYEGGIFTENQELVLYAYWTPAFCELVYQVGDGGTLPDGVVSGGAYYTKDYKLDVPVVEDGSKVFLGWFAGISDTSEQLTDDRGYSIKPWALKQGATVYAHYIKDVFKFTLLEDGTYSVSRGTNASKLTSIVVPQTYNSKPVTVVDGYAFENCSKLVSITIPNSVKIVEVDTAFRGCRKLTDVNIVEVDGTHIPVFTSHDGVLLHKNEITGSMELYYYPEAKTGEYVIPDGVTEIPLKVFEGKPITEVTIPQSVTIIRTNAFFGCTKLEKINFAEGGSDNLVIENGAFTNCSALTSVTFPARLSALPLDEETHALTLFNGCTSLTHVNVERGNLMYASVDGVITDKIGTTLIYCPSARKGSYTVPQGIEQIADYAFYDCNLLTEVVIPGFVEKIGSYAFADCGKLIRVRFSEGAVMGMETEIGDYAFADNAALRNIDFEEGSVVASIGAYAFANAEGLRTLTIPATMTYIGDNAFENAKSLGTVIFEENGSDLEFGNYVFNECINLLKVELPASVVKLNLGVFDGCVNIAEIKVDTANPMYKDENGVVLSKDGKELVFFPKGRQGDENGEYDIPTGVEYISDGAFKGMRYIKKIVIDNTVTTIGKYAFADSQSLETLIFEEGNDTANLVIDEEAFAGCAAITSVVLPERTKTIAAKAFYSVSMSSVKFPAGLESIGDYAFARTALTSVEVPAGVSNFGTYVFAESSALKTFTYADGFAGTEIPVGMFKGTAITSITIPASIEKIGNAAFSSCEYLSEVIFADGGTADLIIGAPAVDADGNVIGDAQDGVFLNCTLIEEIILPDRVTLIGKLAFAGCSGLKTFKISENSNLQRIGEGSFQQCSSLNYFFVPKNVQNTPYVDENTSQIPAIGKMAFANSGLVDLEFQKGGTGDFSFGEYALRDCGGIIGYQEGKFGLEPIIAYMTSITLPNRIAPIYYIYDGGYSETREGVEKHLFSSSFTSITVEEGGKYYGSKDGVFYKVQNVGTEADPEYSLHTLLFVPQGYKGELVVPNTVEYISDGAAGSTTGLTKLSFEATPEGEIAVPLTIGQSAFSGCSKLATIEFPNRLVEIANYAFNNNTSLTAISLPASLERLGDSAFNGCTMVGSLTFETGIQITSIPNSAFYKVGSSNTAFTKITIPASVQKIGTNAFYQCKYVTTLDFEEGSQLTTIENQAFREMVFTEITLPDAFTTVSGDIFGASNNPSSKPNPLQVINLPKTFTSFSTIENGQKRFFLNGLTKLTAVNVHEENPYFYSEDGVIYSKDVKTGGRGNELIYYPRAKTITHTEADGSTVTGKFVTPEGVQIIGTYAFYQNSKLTNLVVSADVTHIGSYSFASSYIASLTFEDRESPLSIGDYAFQSCSRIKGATKQINGVNKSVFEIPEEVKFEGANSFQSAFVSGTVIEFIGENESTALNSTFYGARVSAVYNIPSTLSSMSRTFYNCSSLTEVTFHEDPNGMITTMQATFYNCTKLVSVNLPAVGAMESGAVVSSSWNATSSTYSGVFEKCTALKYVSIKDCNVIGVSTFKGCTSLVGVAEVDENGNPTGKTYFQMPSGVVTIKEGAFYGCTALKEVRTSGSLDTISAHAFQNCTNLETIEIPTFVSSVGKSAFEGCTKLKNLTLGAGLLSIAERAFYGCSAITEITIPDMMESIGDYAFYGCSKLNSIELPASMKTVGEYAFAECHSVETITAQDGLETLGDYAFAGCAKVTVFEVPATLVNLGIGVFEGWESLQDLVVQGGNLDYAFKDGVLYNATYTKIIYVTGNTKGEFVVPETILELADGLFKGTQITSVVLPNTIREIPAEAFRDCKYLESVTMPSNLEKIGYAAFAGCTSLKTITIPKTVYSDFDAEYISFHDGHETGYVLHSNVDGIGAYAFADCVSLENVVFEAGGAKRLSIGDFAFYNCISLKGTLNEETGKYEFRIPNRVRGNALHSYQEVKVEDDGMGGFYYDTGSDSHDKFEQGIGMYAFAECTALQNVVFDDKNTVTMPEKLIIKVGAFYGCTALESVTFNSVLGDYKTTQVGGKGEMSTFAVAAIQARAFEGCRALRTVNFNTELNKFSVVESAFADTNVKLPDGIQYVGGSSWMDYGDGRPNYDTWTDQNYLIDGCAYCKSNGRTCESYHGNNY